MRLVFDDGFGIQHDNSIVIQTISAALLGDLGLYGEAATARLIADFKQA